MKSIYDFSVLKPNGEELSLADFKGKVILIVNTATGCGFTPQYKELEALYEKYHDKGLEIVDIPSNQFGHQTPGTDEEIRQFCQLNYKTQFPQMKKSDVNGKNALPLYTYLKSQQGFQGFNAHKLTPVLEEMLFKIDPDWRKNPDIKWNFTKFLVNRQGQVVARFEPTAPMDKLEKEIAGLI
ncbi:MAG: glutathione peroxidase [Alphaproteobacteria bacterium]